MECESFHTQDSPIQIYGAESGVLNIDCLEIVISFGPDSQTHDRYSALYTQDSHSTLRIHTLHSGFTLHTQNSPIQIHGVLSVEC